jgi:hypothetical protein
MGSSDLLHFVWRKVKKNKNSKMRPWTNKRKEMINKNFKT